MLSRFTYHKGTNKHTNLRILLHKWILVAVCLGGAFIGVVRAEEVKTFEFNIPSQSLIKSLNALSNQTETLVLFPYELVKNRNGNPVVGKYSVEEALDVLLANTGLFGGFSKKGVLTVFEQKPTQKDNKGENGMKTKKSLIATLIGALGSLAASSPSISQEVDYPKASSRQLEEIVVTARKVKESSQDIPVTVTALNSQTIQQYGIDDSYEMANLIPNLTVDKGSSAAGGSVRLRGIGSSVISAAFDSAVAFNVDGLQVNNSALLIQGMFDVEQIEVLKGPQSLYFGKSATAGVITQTSKNPTKDFEAGITTSYEFEEEGKKVDAFVSGPITETLGGRLALLWTDVDEVVKNNAGPAALGGLAAGGPPYLGPGTTTPLHKERGEKSKNARLTLNWEPTEDFSANLKVLVSDWKYDGGSYLTDIQCVGPTAQDTALGFVPGLTFSSGLDCDPKDGVVQIGDIDEIEASGPNHGVPFQKNDVKAVSLNLDYALTDHLNLHSITGWIELENLKTQSSSWDINSTPGTLDAKTSRENYSQEFRLASDFGGKFDFSLGAYYQNRDILLDSYQTAFSSAVIFGPDPVTGRTTSYRKVHKTDVDAWSAYLNAIFRPIETVEISAGARYSKEEHDGDISIPYMHAGLFATGIFLPAGTKITGIHFSDDNISPEVSVLWRLKDNINLYAAYKAGFKSGGIDNSALPTFKLNNSTAGALAFDSEKVDGYEIGMKSDWLENTLRMNVTGFFYTYKDLQTQEFDQAAFNFITLNAGEVETKGIELEMLYATPIDGLTVFTDWAYTDSEYTDDFLVTGETNLLPGTSLENLKGTQIQGNSKRAGNVGFNFEKPVSIQSMPLLFGLGAIATYRSDYQAGIFTNSPHQDDFWKVDATISIASQDERWKLSLIGQNLTDKVTLNSSFAPRTGAVPDPLTGFRDKVVQISHGRQVSLEAKFLF